MFKIKVNKIKSPPEKLFYQGMEALQIPEGTIVKVVYHNEKNNNDIGAVIIRTDNNLHPFRTLQEGPKAIKNQPLWGDALYGYKFEVLPIAKIKDYEPN